jgi:perosamine synthetase
MLPAEEARDLKLAKRQSAKSPSAIPHSRPWITPTDVQAVSRVLRTGALAQGREVQAFEAEVGQYLGMPPGVAVNSGTAALHLALVGLGVKSGDEVILPSYSCVAPLHAVEYVGAVPRLVDSDPATYNLDPDDVKRKLTPCTRAIIAAHMFGLPADVDRLVELGVPVVEDCAQALGARYRNRPVGSYGAVAILSFYATKMLATGEGGMVVSRDRRLLAAIRDLRDYDERRHHVMRYNYKLTDLQAALGRSQLRRFPQMLARRDALARRYHQAWETLPLTLPTAGPNGTHVYYRYVVACSRSAAQIARRLERLGVTARSPVYQPIHVTLGQTGFPGAEQAHRQAVSVPLYPSLTNLEAGAIVRGLPSVLQ